MAPSSRSRSTSGCTKWPRPPSTRPGPTVGSTRRRWALVGLLASAHLVCAATPREAADYLAGSDRTALEALAAGADVVATAESRPGKGPYACRASALVQEVWAAGGLPSLYSAGAWYFIGGFSTNADHHGGDFDFCTVRSGRQSKGVRTPGTWSTRGTPPLGLVLAATPFPVHSTHNPTRVAEEDLGLGRFRGRSGTRACPPGSMLERGRASERARRARWEWRGSGLGVDMAGVKLQGCPEAPRRQDTPRAVPGGRGTAQGGASTLKTPKSFSPFGRTKRIVSTQLVHQVIRRSVPCEDGRRGLASGVPETELEESFSTVPWPNMSVTLNTS